MGTRLDTDATRLLGAARDVARRHRHPSFGPAHVLSALMADATVSGLFVELGVDRDLLLERLDVHLAEQAGSGVYRDGAVDPQPTPALAALLAAACPGRLVSMLRPTTVMQVARAAVEDRELAALLCDAPLEITTARQGIEQARTLARARGHDTLSVHHLMRVLLRQRWVADVMSADVDLGALTRSVESKLDAHVRTTYETRLDFDPEPTEPNELLAAVVQTRAIKGLLWEQRNEADDTLPPESDEIIDIIFANDDVTTMEFVLEVLDECFGIPSPTATTIMLRIHSEGSAVVKSCAAHEARWRIDRARRSAARAAMPLRIRWVRAKDENG